MQFAILGPLEVRDDNGSPVAIGDGNMAVFLNALLCRSGEWVRLHDLADAVWHDHEVPPSAYGNMRTYVWRLRLVFAEHGAGQRIESRRGYYRIRVLPGELDLDEAREAVDSAQAALGNGDPERAVELLSKALVLWRGRPASSFREPTVHGPDELYWTVRERLAEAYIAAGWLEGAVTVLRELSTDDPFREGVWVSLVRLLHGAGRRSEAILAYHQACAILDAELGTEPGKELTLAYRAVLVDEVDLSPAPRGPVTRNDLPRALPQLVGRHDVVDAIEKVARADKTAPTLVTLEGRPGVGKTALAVYLGHRLGPDYPDGQRYVDLRAHSSRGEVSTADALRGLLGLARPQNEVSAADIDQLASLWRATTSALRLLLILDDVVDVEQVRHLAPGAPGSLMVVTSRHGLTGLDASLSLVVEPLRPAAAAKLLANDDFEDPPDADLVARQCGYLPAALHVAGERLRRQPGRTLSNLAVRLAEQGGRRIELAEVVDRILTSYWRLPDDHRLVFRRLCLVRDGRITAGAAAALAGVAGDHAEKVLDRLLNEHLVRRVSPSRYALPALIVDAARQVMLAEDSPNEIRSARERLDATKPGTSVA